MDHLFNVRIGLAIWQSLGGTGFQPVLTQAKAYGYISSCYIGPDNAKCLPDAPAPAPL
jgi:hypothetical protein